jgi:glyoxylase-like metal-dependent hydrolase (beta-lactamase superfamily II)
MASPVPSPSYNRAFSPQPGQLVPVGTQIARVTAPNASDYTFTGTNSFIVGTERVALIDPGPDKADHLAALERAINGRPVDAILLSHTHRDHSAAARQCAEHYKAPLWFGGQHRLSRPLRRFERNLLRHSCDWDLVPDRVLVDGETILAGDAQLNVHTTPGHCANHLAFSMPELILTGDHIMGWNSTLISTPDGSMRDYLASMDKILVLPQQLYVPAHGGPIVDGSSYAAQLKAHRLYRNEQVLDALRHGAETIVQIVDCIYPKQPRAVRMAARMTITAHVEYLEELGQLRIVRSIFGTRIKPR